MTKNHSINNNKPKYNLTITKQIHPKHILTNQNYQNNNALVLTKPLKSNILFNTNHTKKLPYQKLKNILPQITTLNNITIKTTLNFKLHTYTNITKFNILKHNLKITHSTNVQIKIHYNQLPFYPNTLNIYQKNKTTNNNKTNQQLTKNF